MAYCQMCADKEVEIAAKDTRIKELKQQVANLEKYMLRGVTFRDELQSSLAASSAKVEAVIADTRKWYANDMFGPVDEVVLKEIHRLYPGTVDRLSADMTRRTCDLILSNYRAVVKEGT